jgi:hypothetical protein
MEEAPVEPRGPKICIRAHYRGGVGVEVEYLSPEWTTEWLWMSRWARFRNESSALGLDPEWTRSGPGVDPEWTAFGPEWVLNYIENLVNKKYWLTTWFVF